MSEGPSLESLLAELASADADVRTTATGATTTWLVNGVAFAVLAGDVVEIRLDPPIADAATRTPDTDSSPRGPEWVRFRPRRLDQHSMDRLDAWFGLARRRAVAARDKTA